MPSGYTCTVGQRFGFLVSRNATVTLEFHKLDSQGNPSPIVAWTALDGVAETVGLHDVLITSVDLPLGDYSYELKATAADGTVEDYVGSASHHTQQLDSLPLAHSFVKGVDVYSGGAVASEDDITVGGRGPGMKLTRTYASNQGDEEGFFGRGWSTDLDAQVLTNECDTRIVRGSAGQGQRFAPAGTDVNGNVQFTALSGYHGTLVQTGAEYDFYAKDGTRYHFGQFDRSGPRLSYIEDTNGNRVAYTYEVNQGEQHVTRIDDSAGRHIDLTYTIKDVETKESGITIEHVFTIVSDAAGPGGLHVHYDYDAVGNLIKATRSDGSSGDREHAYTYDDLGGYFITQPDGAIQYYRFGYRLKTTTNLLDNAQRSYDYTLGWSAVDVGGGDIQYIPVQRATSVTEPDTGNTLFVYDGVRGLSPVATDVTDARSHGTHYDLNRYGAATTVTDPAGTTQTVWDMTHLEPQTITDALGTVTTFAYDAAGNKTSETIVDASSTIARSWTYEPTGAFTLPYIKNRVATATDGNQNLTQYTYDSHGNPVQITRGGISENDSYDPNGDHASHTDGLQHVWLWRYDANGYPREAEDPLHFVTKTTFDDRGRRLSQTDANAHATSFTYDAQDRVLTTTYPAMAAGSGVQTSTYDDAADKRIDTNANGHATTSSFDTMGRLVGVKRADGQSRALLYDKNGNLTQEADFSGDVTTYVYDDANRRTETHAPESRDTMDEYDALGHVTKETVQASAGSNSRITEYEYKHPLYKRTLVRRHLDARNIDEATQYDNNGNAKQITDPIGRVTTRKYDARDRMFEEDAPYGRVTKTLFDDADRAITQTVKNPGHQDQVTQHEYDFAGRLISTTDAVNDRRTIAYDNTKNVISRSDARSNLTHYVYDARDELTSETGPEAGQVTSYTYDLAGNRVTENWPNGNSRTSSYDALERRTATTDSVGSVESFTYTPDDKIATRTDANGHKTMNHYDGLQRLHQQDLPAVAAGARSIVKDYDVHGDVLSETNAGQHTTQHTYDDLGRLKTTTLPAVNGNSATLQLSYDDVDRPTGKTDARGNVTTISYNDTAHSKTQTEPTTPDGSFSQTWTYDAVGNEVAHTDRRGIVMRTDYDAANRVHSITRDGLTTSTRTYEDGRVKTDTDALNRITTNVYDKAGRRTEEDRPLGAKRTWTYMPIGDVRTATDEDGRTTVSTYTPRRYLESSSLAGETTTYGYDGEGHRTSMQRPLGDAYKWIYVYDAGDRLTSVTDPLSSETAYAYDRDGNLLTQTNANSHATAFTYDARDRRQNQTWPSTADGTAVENWTYDADGNIATQITPNGKTITYSVDALNRTTSESVDSPESTEIASTTWHHDGNGNVISIDETLGDNTTHHNTRHYDAFDRPDHVTDEYGKTPVYNKNLIYRYDSVGNRTVLTDADGQDTTWAYNGLNHNTATTVIGQGTTTIDHYPSGRVHVLTRPDASTTTTEYDEAGRIASIVHAKAGTELAHEAYRYDLNGNRIEQKETNGAVTGDAEQTTTYAYDFADRLTQVVTPDRTTDYTIDPVGNRTGEKIHNAANTLIGNSMLVYNAREQLTSRDDAATSLHVDLTYDADGNTATETDSAGTRTFTYDAHDRLLNLAAPAQLPLTFDYNSDGLRIAKHQGSAETRYQYDQQSLLAETNAIGNTTVGYHYSATQLLSRTEAGSTPNQRQYLTDALNTPIATLTQQGAVDSRTKFDAWGEIVAQQGIGGAVTTPDTDGTTAPLITTDNQDVGFTGYIKDSESGLYYAKARYYDPRIARFTTEDPEAGKAMNPPSLHRYLYAYANPGVYTDPTGRLADGDNIGALRLAAALAHNEADRASLERSIKLQTQNNLEYAGTGYEASKVLLKGGYGLAKYAARVVGKVLFDVGDAKDVIDPLVNATKAVAHTIREGPVGWTEHFAEESSRADALRKQDKFFEAGQVYGPDTAAASMFALPAAGRLAGEIGAADSLAAADAATQTAQVAQQAKNAAQGAQRIVEDAGGGADAVPASPKAVGRSGVYFFDQKVLPYIDREGATLGQQGVAHFFMPAEDSAMVTDAASAYRYSGGAPSLERAYLNAGDVHGVEFPLEGFSPRLPTAADTNLEHFLEGGNTALKLQENGGYLINSTREFVVPGGGNMPAGSRLFKIAPDGARVPIRSW